MSDKKFTSDELEDFYKGSYVEKLGKQPVSRLRRLLPYFELKDSDIVADFGCGDGLLLSLIYSRVRRYVGIDFSEDFIAAANKRYSQAQIHNATFQRADIIAFCSQNNNTFDKAFTMDFSEHIYDDMFLSVYSAIFNSLKDNGKLYLHTPNGNYLLEILKNRGVLKQFPQHVAVRNAEENTLLLRQAGFSHVAVHFLPHYVRPLSYLHFLSYIPLIGRYFQARLLIVCSKT